jgi:hypothetical protein
MAQPGDATSAQVTTIDIRRSMQRLCSLDSAVQAGEIPPQRRLCHPTDRTQGHVFILFAPLIKHY